MPASIVLDASVAAKCFVNEAGSHVARRLAGSGLVLIAPDLVLIELASVAAKKVRRAELSPDAGAQMIARAADLFDELTPTRPLLEPAYRIAAASSLSLYDSLYLALAGRQGLELVTADLKLVAAAAAAGLGEHVRALG
jgi:predicted nucleic acid-binding protein